MKHGHSEYKTRKLYIWDSKRCALQFCHSKHRLRKNGTLNIRQLIILPFEVFFLFFFFLDIWEDEISFLPLCFALDDRVAAVFSYRPGRHCRRLCRTAAVPTAALLLPLPSRLVGPPPPMQAGRHHCIH
jgi:hypothetical protein